MHLSWSYKLTTLNLETLRVTKKTKLLLLEINALSYESLRVMSQRRKLQAFLSSLVKRLLGFLQPVMRLPR